MDSSTSLFFNWMDSTTTSPFLPPSTMVAQLAPWQYEEAIVIKRSELIALKMIKDEWLGWIEELARGAQYAEPTLPKALVYHYASAETKWVHGAIVMTEATLAAMECAYADANRGMHLPGGAYMDDGSANYTDIRR